MESIQPLKQPFVSIDVTATAQNGAEVNIQKDITLSQTLEASQQELIDQIDLSPEALQSLEGNRKVASLLQVFRDSLELFNRLAQVFKRPA